MLTPSEKIVLAVLAKRGGGYITLKNLSWATGFQPTRLHKILLKLEIMGFIKIRPDCVVSVIYTGTIFYRYDRDTETMKPERVL